MFIAVQLSMLMHSDTYCNRFFHRFHLHNLCIRHRVFLQEDMFPKQSNGTYFEDSYICLRQSHQGSLFYYHTEPGTLCTKHSDIETLLPYNDTLEGQKDKKQIFLSCIYSFSRRNTHIRLEENV